MKVGDTYEIKASVTDENTATAAGSGALRVFGTPYLAALMENAALTYIKEDLEKAGVEGKSTVGTVVHVEHTSPTPVGMDVTVKVTVTEISANGKMIDFDMEAWDEAGVIGRGHHQRAVIDVERFMEKCYSKLEG